MFKKRNYIELVPTIGNLMVITFCRILSYQSAKTPIGPFSFGKEQSSISAFAAEIVTCADAYAANQVPRKKKRTRFRLVY